MWLCNYIKSRVGYKRSACYLDDFCHEKKYFPTSAEKIFEERKNRGGANASRQYATHPRAIFRSSDDNPAQENLFFIAHCLRRPCAARALAAISRNSKSVGSIVWLQLSYVL